MRIIASAMNENRRKKRMKEKKETIEQRRDGYIPGASGHGAGRMRRVILPGLWSQVWCVVCDNR